MKRPAHIPFQVGTSIWYETSRNTHNIRDWRHDRDAGAGKTMAQMTSPFGTSKYGKTKSIEAFDKVREALNMVDHVK